MLSAADQGVERPTAHIRALTTIQSVDDHRDPHPRANFPHVNTDLVDGRALIRQDSTLKESTAGINRADHLCVFPETDPVFLDLFGLREDSESHHNKLKNYNLWGGRARSINPEVNQLDHYLWMWIENTRARVAHAERIRQETPPIPSARAG